MRISPIQPVGPTEPVGPIQPAHRQPARPYPATPQPTAPAARVAKILRQAGHRLLEARVPFRIGQLVVGDDPFNGRREGTVEVIRPPFVGLRVPGTPAGTLFFFDHRNLRRPE